MKLPILFRLILLSLFVCVSVLVAQDPDKGKPDPEGLLSKTNGTPLNSVLNINNITAWQRSDGRIWGAANGDPSTIYPKGTVSAIYGGGILWEGKAYLNAAKTSPAPGQLIRMGGHYRASSGRAGRIIGSGATAVGADPAGADVRMYRIRREYTRLSPDEQRQEASDFFQTPLSSVTDVQVASVLSQYDKDWKEWPVQYGAPYVDRNRNGSYEPPPAFSATFTVDSLIAQNRDEPGVAGADPNSPADQVMWTVYNDVDPAPQLVTSEKLGIEAQATVWGYKSTGPLGQMFFRRVKIINKGGVVVPGGQKVSLYIDSMYIAQESDPDLGNFTEDIIGCDTTLSIAFIYNGVAVDAQYKTFGLPPPAIGYDFLQGPRIVSPGDSAVFDLKRLKNWKNLPMTNFGYFTSGGAIADPPTNSYEGVLRWWKLIRGFVPDPSTAPDRLYSHPPGYPITKYPLSGDPVTKTGFLDGLGTQYSFAPGDRRIVLGSGPFTLAPGDTQELVLGYVGGLGSDRISSVAVMKFNDRFAQNTYDALFSVPRPPTPPNVKVAELDGQVILEWASDVTRVADTEGKVNDPGSYVFEGYNVYQLSRRDSPFSSAKRIATYDLATDPGVVLDEKFDPASGQILKLPVQFGTNSGVKRYFVFKRDYVKDLEEVFNGKEYYLAVTSYSRATVPGFLPGALESDPRVLIVTPKVPFGKSYGTVFGDTVKGVTHTGSSEGSVTPTVVDPSAVTGDSYEVGFDRSSVGKYTWKVTNKTKNKVVVSGQSNQSGDDRYPVVEGVMVKVASPDLMGKTATVTPSADRWYQQGVGAVGEVANGGAYLAAKFMNGSTVEALDYKTVEVRFVKKAGFTDLNGNAVYNVGEPYSLPATGIQKGYFYTGLADNTFEGFFDLPFTVWDVSNPASPRQLNVVVLDPDQNKQWDLHTEVIDPLLPNGGNQANNFVWVTASTYDATGIKYDPTKPGGAGWMGNNQGANEAYWVLWMGLRAGREPYGAPITVSLVPYKVNSNLDTYSFSTSPSTTSSTMEKASAARIGVFPNPYYAFNPSEINRFGRFVTFNNLPPKATVRIFNLAGENVRILRKDDQSQFLQWDLTNDNSFPVASGIYLAHVEAVLPADGSVVSKLLKIAIIQEQEILDVY